MKATDKPVLRTVETTSTHIESDSIAEDGTFQPYTALDEVPEKQEPAKIELPYRPRLTTKVNTDQLDKIFQKDPYADLWARLKE